MMETQNTFLVVGLGNPGKEHRSNRHNIGFMLLDVMAQEYHCAFSRRKSKSLVTDFTLDGSKIILAKPQTFMNLSGRAVAPLLRFFRIPTERLLVAYDELDLPLGMLRMRPGGGSGGHRGMSSIIHELGTQDFPRLRLGIDRPPGRMDPADYVLQNFRAEDQELILDQLRRACECVSMFIQEGIQAAMTCCNTI